VHQRARASAVEDAANGTFFHGIVRYGSHDWNSFAKTKSKTNNEKTDEVKHKQSKSKQNSKGWKLMKQ
jgi:hypothetical protein